MAINDWHAEKATFTVQIPFKSMWTCVYFHFWSKTQNMAGQLHLSPIKAQCQQTHNRVKTNCQHQLSRATRKPVFGVCDQVWLKTVLLRDTSLLESWNFEYNNKRYYTNKTANKKGADQTAQMRRLICAFVLRIWHKQVLWWCGSTRRREITIFLLWCKCQLISIIWQLRQLKINAYLLSDRKILPNILPDLTIPASLNCCHIWGICSKSQSRPFQILAQDSTVCNQNAQICC